MKNLKMFAIAVMAFAVMAMGVHADAAADFNTAKSTCATAENVKVQLGGVNYTCDTITNTLNLVEKYNAAYPDTKAIEVTLTILEKTTDTSVTIDGTKLTKVTLDLNGKGAVVSNGVQIINGGSLVVSGKTGIDETTGKDYENLIVNGGEHDLFHITGPKASLTINKEVTAETKSTGHGKYVVALLPDGNDSAKNTKINIAGKLIAKTESPILGIEGNIKKEDNAAKITISDGAVLDSTGNSAIYQAGYAETTIGKAEVSGLTAIMVRAGKMTINGATVTGTLTTRGAEYDDMVGGMKDSGAAIQVESTDRGDYYGPATVVLNGGTYTSEKYNAIAINNYSATKLALSKDTKIGGGASLVSGTDDDDKILPGIALRVNNTDVLGTLLTNLTGLVSNAKFNGPVTGDVAVNGGTKPAEDILAKLVVGDTTTDESGNTVVGTGAPADEQKPDENQGDQTTGDGNQGSTDIPSNPNTNDNILVYAGLGLVSLASVAFTAKKRED